MKNLSAKFLHSILFAGMMVLLVISTALALTPTLDGDDTGDWGTAPTTCTIGAAGCSRIIDDAQDVTPVGSDYYDVKSIFLTNDSTNLYFRTDFWGNGTATQNSWDRNTSTAPNLSICVDIDNDDLTGFDVPPGTCDGDETMSGVDYRLLVRSQSNGNPLAPQVFSCADEFCDVFEGTGAIGYDSVQPAGDTDTITEFSIPQSMLGLSTTCPGGGPQPCTIELGLYYDNGVTPTDDSVPTNGFATAQIGSNSPTAVTLTNLSIRNNTPFWVAGLAGILLMGGALLFLRLRKTKTI
ncbi:MAG: hypothetical protein HUU38_29870 [Anaerolineales bacterium]|nr:hypothetical protein [Anaerolineales bacterium]